MTFSKPVIYAHFKCHTTAFQTIHHNHKKHQNDVTLQSRKKKQNDTPQVILQTCRNSHLEPNSIFVATWKLRSYIKDPIYTTGMCSLVTLGEL